ncbi:MAG: S8 family serine peptidase [Planctomycetota bacterium]
MKKLLLTIAVVSFMTAMTDTAVRACCFTVKRVHNTTAEDAYDFKVVLDGERRVIRQESSDFRRFEWSAGAGTTTLRWFDPESPIPHCDWVTIKWWLDRPADVLLTCWTREDGTCIYPPVPQVGHGVDRRPGGAVVLSISNKLEEPNAVTIRNLRYAILPEELSLQDLDSNNTELMAAFNQNYPLIEDTGVVIDPNGVIELTIPEPVPPAAVLAYSLEVVGDDSNAVAEDMGQHVMETSLIRNYTPPVWQADDVNWVGDVDPHNKIDDLIDDACAVPPLDIVVNYKRCVEQPDLDWLEALNPEIVVSKLKYISSVAVSGASIADVNAIAAVNDIAFIELQGLFEPTLDVSLEAIRVAASATYSPNTVADRDANLDGSGVNIAIMDTGVDDTVHDAFNATPYVAGYDAHLGTLVNPNDVRGHGTHVASIALGQATANTSRGVAPAAGLIDVKCIPGTWAQATDALETIYDNRDNWDVDIINMSFGQRRANHDGTESFSQLVDLAEAMGIVVVAAVGNDGPNNNGISTPAAATRAIAVAAANDINTVDRSDDAIADFSSRGPRADDGDSDVLDELKPEVTAPGCHADGNDALCTYIPAGGCHAPGGIRAAQFNTTDGRDEIAGTSMASPLVAGLAALIIQVRPGINPASVKDLIISTAERRGAASRPADDPEWNDGWGWGLVDAFAAIDAAMAADLTYPSHPPSPSWMSPDISVSPSPKVGQQSTVTVQVENKGPANATDARIHFGVHDYAASTPTFYDIGTQVVDLPVGITAVSMNWTPSSSGHMCMKVEIGYHPDTDYSNNKAQRNLTVASSPVWFKVANTLTVHTERIDFEANLEYDTDPPWMVAIDPPYVELGPDDCPAEIRVELIPPYGAKCGDQIAHIAAKIGDVVLGGVSVLDSVDYVLVDDMESYNNTDKPIYETWEDGWYNDTGAEVALGQVSQGDPVHGGYQSMKYIYDNTIDWGEGYYSEIARTFDDPCDWTALGIRALVLYFYGDPGNDAGPTEQMYVGLEDSRGAVSYAQVNYGFYGEDMNDIKEPTWHQWDLDLQDFTGVDLTDVNNLYIGFGIRSNPVVRGGYGIVYFDDVRLCRPFCRPHIARPTADLSGNCRVAWEDIRIMAADWLNTDICDGQYYPLLSPANLFDAEPPCFKVVNARDFAILADQWLTEILWPDD